MRVRFRVNEVGNQPSSPKTVVVAEEDLTHIMVLAIKYCMDLVSVLLSMEMLNQTAKQCEREGRLGKLYLYVVHSLMGAFTMFIRVTASADDHNL